MWQIILPKCLKPNYAARFLLILHIPCIIDNRFTKLNQQIGKFLP